MGKINQILFPEQLASDLTEGSFPPFLTIYFVERAETFFTVFFLKDFIYLFLERGEGREEGRE